MDVAVVTGTPVVIGADVGGSTTRIAVVDQAGFLLARVDAEGANPNVIGPEAAAARIGAAARAALEQAAGGATGAELACAAMVLGLAGGSRVATDATFLTATSPDPALRPRIVSDLEVAFASAAETDHGSVLIAGTGAVAGRLADGQLVAVHDGWGWLLGDGGAGFWLGREAVRATLRRLETGGELDDLHRAVLSAAAVTDRLGLVGACYAAPPLWLAQLAPLVSRHATEPDGDAAAIATTAAQQLAELVLHVAAPASGPVVLAGSVATRPGPIAHLLRRRLAMALGPDAAPVLTARSGLVGAAWLALRDSGAPTRDVHARLVSALDDAT